MKTKVFLQAFELIYSDQHEFSCNAIGEDTEVSGGELYFYQKLFNISFRKGHSTFTCKYLKLDGISYLDEDQQDEEVKQIRLLALCLAQVIWDSGERF